MEGRKMECLSLFKGCAKEMPTNHWRLQAVTLIIPNNRILILNSYFPTDSKVSDFDTSDLLSKMRSLAQWFGLVTSTQIFCEIRNLQR